MKTVVQALFIALILILCTEIINQFFFISRADRVITYNSIGARSHNEINDISMGGRETILFLGNSVILGKDIEDEQILTSILSDRLSNIDVVNAGYDGANLLQLFNIYKKELHKIHPGTVVWIPVPGDFETVYDLEQENELPVQYQLSQSNKIEISRGVVKLRLTILDTMKYLNIELRKYITSAPGIYNVQFTWEDQWYTEAVGKTIENDIKSSVEALLSKMKAYIESNNGRFIIVLVPPREFYYIYK